MILTALVQAAVISLQCEGTATIAVEESVRSSAYSGGDSAYGSSTFTSRTRQADRLLIEIDGEVVKIRPPASMAPTLGGKGEGGWRELTDVVITDRSITGRYAYNWINRPTVNVNRMTGDVEIVGGNRFSGVCQRVTVEAPLF